MAMCQGQPFLTRKVALAKVHPWALLCSRKRSVPPSFDSFPWEHPPPRTWVRSTPRSCFRVSFTLRADKSKGKLPAAGCLSSASLFSPHSCNPGVGMGDSGPGGLGRTLNSDEGQGNQRFLSNFLPAPRPAQAALACFLPAGRGGRWLRRALPCAPAPPFYQKRN